MKKLLLWIIVTVVCLSMLFGFGMAGCKKAAEETVAAETTAAETTAAETTAAETTAAETTMDPNIPIIMNLWTWATSDATRNTDKLVAELIHKKYPNVTLMSTNVEYSSYWAMIKTAIAGDQMPDVMLCICGINGIGLEKAGALVDLRPYIEKDADWAKWMKPVSDNFAAYYYYGPNKDKIIMNPLSAQTMVVGYSKKLYPNGFPKTLDEWYVESKRLNAEGIVPLAVGWAEPEKPMAVFNIFVYQVDTDPNKESWTNVQKGVGKWTDPVFVEAMTIIKKMWDEKVFSSEAFQQKLSTDAFDMLMGGKAAAAFHMLSSNISTMEAKGWDSSDMGVAYMPVAKEGIDTVGVNTLGSSYAVPVLGKHKDLAIEIVKMYSSPEVRTKAFEGGWEVFDFEGRDKLVPKVKNIALYESILELGASVKSPYGFVDNVGVSQALDLAITNVCLGTWTIEVALAEVQKVADSVKE